jgi:hypothetical protein
MQQNGQLLFAAMAALDLRQDNQRVLQLADFFLEVHHNPVILPRLRFRTTTRARQEDIMYVTNRCTLARAGTS